MDCNKDEAIKAKGVAEKKLEIKDYAGAKKFAIKAQQLYSDVDGILQMMTVIDVHLSAAQMLGTEMDWYGILKVEVKADDVSIKKQYRKLALLLHPDKNKLAGAEAAFKLVGEAHRVLIDRERRSKYDNIWRAYKERPVLHKQAQKSTFPVPRQPGASNGYGNVSRTQFTSVNLQREQNQPGIERPTFWTVCPFCTMRYQYYRDILNRALRCQNCMKPFIAHDLNVQGVPSGANCAQPAAPQANKVSQDGCKVGPQSSGQNFFSTVGHQGHKNPATAAASSFVNKGTTNVSRGSKTKVEEDENVKGTARTESQKRSNANGETYHASKKKRKSDAESSESCDTESSSEELKIPDNFRVPEGRDTRRSTRQKRQVTYNEDEDSEDDTLGSPKDTRSPAFGGDQNKKAARENAKPDGLATGTADDILKKESAPENGNEAAAAEDSKRKSEPEPVSEDKTLPDPEFIEVPDPEFHEFDNDRKEHCFKRQQLWAVYDNMDGMPRFYARIKQVDTPGFKVRITWMEPDPDDQDEIDWVMEDLPVSCGMYKYGKTEVTEDVNMFSHIVNAKSIRRGLIVIYPVKGETWALYKNWDIKWNSDPDNHRDYAYEFVEIMSDYDEKSGILVAYMEKVKGFVSLFRPEKGVALVNIPPHELYRFSHMVPCYRTTGKERDGVPEGSFELDPASLPGDLVKANDV